MAEKIKRVRFNICSFCGNDRFSVCWLCGSDKNITPHHLSKSDIQPELMKRMQEGRLMEHPFDKEPCIPLCRECHDAVEYYKMMKNKGWVLTSISKGDLE